VKSISYNEGIIKRLKKKRYALGLLQHAFEESCRDGNWGAFGIVLENVIAAQGNKRSFAKEAKLSRQHLYRLFGKKANPTLKTLLPVLSQLGFQLTISNSKGQRKG